MWGQDRPAKVARTGVPFYLSHTIVKAEGSDHVTGATIAEVDNHFQFIPGTEKHFDVDTICLAVGLSPMSQLLKMAGCEMEDNPKRGGQKTAKHVFEGEKVIVAAGYASRKILGTVGIDVPMSNDLIEALVTEAEPKMFAQMLGTADADFYGHQTDHGSFVFGGASGMETVNNEDAGI